MIRKIESRGGGALENKVMVSLLLLETVYSKKSSFFRLYVSVWTCCNALLISFYFVFYKSQGINGV